MDLRMFLVSEAVAVPHPALGGRLHDTLHRHAPSVAQFTPLASSVNMVRRTNAILGSAS